MAEDSDLKAEAIQPPKRIVIPQSVEITQCTDSSKAFGMIAGLCISVHCLVRFGGVCIS